MDTINYIAPMTGFLLLVGGAITAAIALLFCTVEVKRIIVLAGVLFFCGTFLLLYERVTVLELPASLGKITVQAKQDAKGIRDIRIKMEAQKNTVTTIVEKVSATADHVSALAVDIETQQKTVTGLVAKMKEASSRVSTLSTETESKFSDVRKSQIADRKQYLLNQLEEVRESIRSYASRSFAEKNSIKRMRMTQQRNRDIVKEAQLLDELQKLKDEGQSPGKFTKSEEY